MQSAFKIGDKAVYPSQGVTEVMGIETKEISGNRQIFYVLRVIDSEKKIWIPIDKVESVGLREVISQDQVHRVFTILRQRNVPADNQTWNRRYRRYLEKIKTGSVYDVAEVLRDLCLLKNDKSNLSFGERKMLDTARTLLVQELAVAMAQGAVEVEGEIDRIFLPPVAN